MFRVYRKCIIFRHIVFEDISISSMLKLNKKSVVFSFAEDFSKNVLGADGWAIEGLYEFTDSTDDLQDKLKTGAYSNLAICVDANTPKNKLLNIINYAVSANVEVEVVNHAGEGSKKMSIISERNNHAQIQLGRVFNDTEPDDERLKIVTRTAATLNHRINNSLLAISANAEMLMKQCQESDPKIKERLKTICLASDHIRDVIGNLSNLKNLSFTGTATGQMINLDNIPEDVICGLNIPTGVPLIYELDDDLKPIPRPDANAPSKVVTLAIRRRS